MREVEDELPLNEHKLRRRVKDPEHQGSMEMGASTETNYANPSNGLARAQERIDHLDSVLKSVRGIHKAIPNETDRERLARTICDELVKHRGYLSAVLILFGDENEMPFTASAGIDEASISTFQEQINNGKMPHCVAIAAKEDKAIEIGHAVAECEESCPIKRTFVNRKEFIARLSLGKRTFGVLTVSIPARLSADETELALFHSVSVEIALTLGYLEANEIRRKKELLNKDQLEALIKERTSELRVSNEELQYFAYVASHDLQEPLRMISSFLQLLSDRYSGKLDKDADEFIRYTVEAAARLQNMIEGLLTISRVDSRRAEFIVVDMKDVIEEVLGNLAIRIDDEKVNISVGDMPTIKADRFQMAQLIQNLVENAIKFRGKNTPRIEISAKRGKGEWIFSVRDNGIGIDSKYFERIFVVFQRLHAGDAYKGIGIGVSIAKKIVERHGGRIWLESEVDKGSIFYFTIRDAKGELNENERNSGGKTN